MDEAEQHDPTVRFGELIAAPEPTIRLDEACTLIAAHAEPGLDGAAVLARLDELAAACTEPTLDGVRHLLFTDLGFDGARDDYYDPDNSFLHHVLQRRRGIPITLAIVMIEVGRRVGAPLAGVSMPGHFLVRDRVDPELFIDPYHRGALLDRNGCRALFEVLHGGRLSWDDAFLDPVSARPILGRVLANLRAIYLARRDRPALLWVQRLRAMFPDAAHDEVRELAAALAANGRLDEAADLLDAIAEVEEDADVLVADQRLAAALRARLN